jgi:nucleoside-diphosphate-sugar epimerase
VVWAEVNPTEALEEWRTPSRSSTATWEHIARSPNASIAKAERLIDYRPRYSSLQAVFEAVTWLIEHGKIIIA